MECFRLVKITKSVSG